MMAASLVVKVIGAFFQIPLQNLIGGEKSPAFGMFSAAYRIYTAMLVVSTVGLPAALSKMVAEATGLNITRYMSGSQGGDQQISARIACDEIDLLLFFRDPMTVKAHEPNESDMFRLCDMRNIPVATNIATAEVLIHGLERGDLDWRNIVNPGNP